MKGRNAFADPDWPTKVRDNPLLSAFYAASTPEDQPYFAALGTLISAYAAAEAGIHMLARHLSGLSDEKARGIFGGMRIGDLRDRVRHIMRCDDSPTEFTEEVESCLSQFDVIGEQRDRLVHRYVDYANRFIRVHNLLTAKSLKHVDVTLFTLDNLRNMYVDCLCISYRLGRLIAPPEDPDANPDFVAFARSPWRYKPPQPDTPRKPSRKPKVSVTPRPRRPA